MKLREYIDKYYPIREKVMRKLKNPVQRVLEMDDLPCDDVRAVDGQLQKIIYVNDEEYVSVVDILSYTKGDIDKMSDCDFKSAWLAYMENVHVEDISIEELMRVSKEYVKNQRQRREMAEKCMS